MSDIVLATLNARYAHASFGLRWLMANLPEELAPRATILEFDSNQRPTDIVEKILLQNPKIVGLGVYIWNSEQSLHVVSQLKRLRPEVTVVLGGPEVSYETERQEICALVDYVICGEADIAFGELCARLLRGDRPLMKVMQAELPEFEGEATKRRSDGATKGEDKPNDPLFPFVASSLRRSVALPYSLYTPHDLARRVVYVEASRGCPFKCEFCLSSLDVPVRNVPIDLFLEEMQKLLDRGLKQFKFVDRTFNLNINISKAILQFFLDRYFDGLFLHFEMIPDRLPEALRELIEKFPAGALQFEVGIQTFNPEVEKLISRRQDHAKMEDNLRWLRGKTGVHVHTDLIVGLPGEDIESFGRGFDRLVSLRPQEIQVGILKRLRGTPVVRHDQAWEMIYSPHAPYEVLQTKLIDFPTMQRMKRFARYWDLIANSGNFVETTSVLLGANSFAHVRMGEGGGEGSLESGALCFAEKNPHPDPLPDYPEREQGAFQSFLKLSDWLFETTGQTHAISLTNLAELIFKFCRTILQIPAPRVAQAIWSDFQRVGRSDRPEFLKPYVAPADTREIKRRQTNAPSRQAKHLR
jgi:radical SAM superfamily enzyme YgiQ (UPF0313 family)